MNKRKSADNDKTVSKKMASSCHWSMGLLKSAEDPKLVVKSDDIVTIIKDAYPKAKYHYLVLPRDNISNLKSLTSEHLELLKHMEKIGKDLIGDEKHKDCTFKLGYHAEASMFKLHMHIISDDMNSTCLKSKKHWNSFVTEFFLKSEDVVKSLESNGKVILPSREKCKGYIDTPLQCHKCEYLGKSMPDLKKHILKHIK